MSIALLIGETGPVETYSNIHLLLYIAGLRREQRLCPGRATRLVDVSTTHVSKRYNSSQKIYDALLAIELARSLNIRTPRVRRVVQLDNFYECIFDRVEGVNLVDAWTDLGWIKTIRTGFQLRGMVQRMHSVTSPTTGSLGTGIARSFWLKDYYHLLPPRCLSDGIMSTVNFWYNAGSFAEESTKTKEQHGPTYEGPLNLSQPLVFTHDNLSPQNLMIDSVGDLHIVDWDSAGWYPPFFEHSGMYKFEPPKSWGYMGMLRWKLFTWIATGFYSREKDILTTGCINASYCSPL